MMERYLEITKTLMDKFESSTCSSLDCKFEGYSLSLKREIKEEIKVKKVLDEEKNEVKEDLKNIEEIKSPLVGVYYSAAEPKSDDFVKIGDRVKEGDVLCILESMKMMNEIKSPCDGVIREILCENEEAVEFDQLMFILEKTNA